MKIIEGKVNRNIALNTLASGAVFKPLKSDYSGRYSSACGLCMTATMTINNHLT